MTCASCGFANPPGHRFCGDCGAPLAATCPACGFANQPGLRFCGQCGTRLAGWPGAEVGPPPTAVPAVPAPTAPAAEAERRLVTVLFADLVGFTTLAEGRDPEETRELLTRYFDLARAVIGRYGGTVEKFIGDAVMALWGAPVAHEDDAERAVRAGLELVDSVRTIAPGISARCGILTGEAAVTVGATGQGLVAGDLVNTASRLQSVALPGSVLVGEATMRGASGAIAFEPAGEQSLKGVAAPLATWRALRVVAERGGRNRSSGLEAPFVGRDAELRQLKDLLHATSGDRRVRLVSISGQGGIGKSRLAWEFKKYLDGLVETVYWHSGRSPAYGSGLTFWALAEMVRQRAGLSEGAVEATIRSQADAALARWLPDEEERRWVEPALLRLLGASEAHEPGDGAAAVGGREQLFGAWRTFFERIAAEGTTVLLFEDLQWADAGLLDFIDHLTEWSRGFPLFIVTLARPELLEKRPDWGAGKRNFTSITLEPLPSEHMRALLAGLAPGLPGEAVERIVGRADGVPLYAVETVRMLVAEGRLVEQDGAYHPRGDLSTIAVPDTLRSLIGSRLDALEPSDRALLQAAAVLGQSFTVESLAAVTGEDLGGLEARLRTVVRREMLTLDTDPRSPERGQYAFVQALIREVAYATLARRDRKERHLAAARYFERLGSEDLVGALAAQYLDAYRNAGEGPEADALAVQARLALRAAGDRARSLGSPEQALGYFREAMEVASDARERAVLLEMAGGAATTAGRYDEAETLCEEAIAAFRALGDGPATARATSALVDAMVGRFRLQAALAVLEPAVEELADLERDPAFVGLVAQLARVRMMNGDTGSLPTADRALELAERLDDPAIVADLLVTRGAMLFNAGRGYESLADLEAGLRLAVAHGLVRTELRARTNLAGPLSWSDPRAQLENCRAGVALGRRAGVRYATSLLLGNGAEMALHLGEWDWAARELRSALETESGDERLRARFFLLPIAAERGEDISEEMAELAAVFADRARQGEPNWEPAAHHLRASAALPAGRWTEAADALLTAASQDPFNAVGDCWGAGVAASLAGEASRCRAALRGLDEAGIQGTLMRNARLQVQAGLDALEGRSVEAMRGFAQVIDGARAAGLRRTQGLAGLQMAALLDPAHPLVAAAVAEARSTWESLGARAWLDRLDEILATATRSPAAAGEPTSSATLAQR